MKFKKHWNYDTFPFLNEYYLKHLTFALYLNNLSPTDKAQVKISSTTCSDVIKLSHSDTVVPCLHLKFKSESYILQSLSKFLILPDCWKKSQDLVKSKLDGHLRYPSSHLDNGTLVLYEIETFRCGFLLKMSLSSYFNYSSYRRYWCSVRWTVVYSRCDACLRSAFWPFVAPPPKSAFRPLLGVVSCPSITFIISKAEVGYVCVWLGAKESQN